MRNNLMNEIKLKLPLLSGEVDSIVINEEMIKVGIDRIEGSTKFITKYEIQSLGSPYEEKYLKKEYGYIKRYQISNIDVNLIFKDKLHETPYRFFFKISSLSNTGKDIKNLLHTVPSLLSSRVTRVDINADFSLNKRLVDIALQISNKKMFKKYFNTANSTGGSTYGKEDELIRVYDRTERLDLPVTRLEIQLRNKRLPRKRTLSHVLRWILEDDHFKSVQVCNIITKKDTKSKSNFEFLKALKKYWGFIQIQMNGQTHAKKESLHPKNFHRGLSDFIRIEKSSVSLLKIFQRKMTKLIGGRYE